MSKRNKILVTGGAGFIGSHVASELVNLGHQVTVLDDLSGGFRENVNPSAQFIEGSITNHEFISKLFAERQFDFVYHLAAYAAEGLSHFIKRFNYENNLIGSVNLINASVNNNIKGFVFTSSIAVYGAGQLPLREDTVPQPEDSYGIAKYAVEQELKVSHEMFGLPHIIFRPHNVFGEKQNIADKYRNVIGIFMNNLMQGKPMAVFGDGEQQRAFTYISDVARTIASSIFEPKAYGQVFNIGGDEVMTVNKLAEIVGGAMGVEFKIEHLPPRNEVKNAYSDHSKVKEIFGYRNTVSIEEGIKRMAAWALRVGSKKSRDFENIEVKKNFPVGWG